MFAVQVCIRVHTYRDEVLFVLAENMAVLANQNRRLEANF